VRDSRKESRADQIRDSRAKKTPDRRGPQETEELTDLRGDSRQTDADKNDRKTA
jgi:hypothetical protein